MFFLPFVLVYESNVKSPVSVSGAPEDWEIPCSGPGDCPPSWRCNEFCSQPIGFSGAPADGSLLYSPERTRYQNQQQ